MKKHEYSTIDEVMQEIDELIPGNKVTKIIVSPKLQRDFHIMMILGDGICGRMAMAVNTVASRYTLYMCLSIATLVAIAGLYFI